MLKQRIITAAILVLTLVGVLFFAPSKVFVGFVGIVLLAAAWEWANLCHLLENWQQLLYAAFVIALGLGSWWLIETQYYAFWTTYTALLVSSFWWAIALLWVQSYPSSSVFWQSKWARMIMGLLVLLPAWLGVSFLREMPNGVFLVFSVVVIVAAADTGAYFTGKAFGKRKLAPNVSPGKSWEGVAGGLVAVFCLSVLFNFLHPVNGGLLTIIAIALPTALVSVVGDLLESMLKRFRGIKDSSNLLPGHGGILDRIDGLVAAIPIFSLALLSTGWQW